MVTLGVVYDCFTNITSVLAASITSFYGIRIGAQADLHGNP